MSEFVTHGSFEWKMDDDPWSVSRTISEKRLGTSLTLEPFFYFTCVRFLQWKTPTLINDGYVMISFLTIDKDCFSSLLHNFTNDGKIFV